MKITFKCFKREREHVACVRITTKHLNGEYRHPSKFKVIAFLMLITHIPSIYRDYKLSGRIGNNEK